jgi:uncharacterized protein (TIRG00374 family)
MLIVVRWAAALGVLAMLLHFLPWALLRAAIARVPVPSFLAVLLGYLAAHAVGAEKWRLVVNTAGAELDRSTSVQCYAGGLFGTLFLPSIVGGDVVRLAVGLRKSPRPAAVLAGNLVDRFLDVTAQAGLVLLGLALLPGALPPGVQGTADKAVFAAATVGLLIAGLVFLLRKPILSGRSVRFRKRLARLRHALRAVSKRRQVLILGWLMGTAIQMTFLVLSARLAAYCGLNLPLRVWLFAWPLAKLAAILPLTQGGIGIREAALVGVLAPFGAPGAVVLAAGLVWEGVIIAGGLIAGALAILLGRRASRATSPSAPG